MNLRVMVIFPINSTDQFSSFDPYREKIDKLTPRLKIKFTGLAPASTAWWQAKLGATPPDVISSGGLLSHRLVSATKDKSMQRIMLNGLA